MAEYEEYQQRVVDEKIELDLKLGKLNLFFETETFDRLPVEEKDRMKSQAGFMEGYSKVLEARIANFSVPRF